MLTWLAGQLVDWLGWLERESESEGGKGRTHWTVHNDPEKTILFTISIFIAVPASYLFFIPFFFAKSFNMNFLLIYACGIAMLIIGYFVHKYVANFL